MQPKPVWSKWQNNSSKGVKGSALLAVSYQLLAISAAQFEDVHNILARKTRLGEVATFIFSTWKHFFNTSCGIS